MKKFVFIFGLIFTLLRPLYAQEVQINRVGEALYFEGQINHDSANILIGHLRTGVKQLFISSKGGNAEAALDIAMALRQAQASITVTRYCYSSCANYLFLTAKEKTLRPNAILGFHGGFDQEVTPEVTKSLPEKFSRLLQRDSDLLRILKIDRKLFRLSYELTKPTNPTAIYIVTTKQGEQKFENEKEAEQVYKDLKQRGEFVEFTFEFRGLSETKVYFPSEGTLKKYGVTGIQYYYYPNNREELERLAKENEVEIVSDLEQR